MVSEDKGTPQKYLSCITVVDIQSWGFPARHGGTPKTLHGKNFMEKPIQKWMRTGGTPILGNLHIDLTIVTHGDMTQGEVQFCRRPIIYGQVHLGNSSVHYMCGLPLEQTDIDVENLSFLKVHSLQTVDFLHLCQFTLGEVQSKGLHIPTSMGVKS